MRGSTSTRGHILVVDDERAIADVLVKSLTREGYQVHTAHDGRAALVQLATLPVPPFLVVTDLRMPGMNGVEFLEALHAASLDSDLAVLVVTGNPEEAPARARVLPKPIDLLELTQIVHEIWAKRAS